MIENWSTSKLTIYFPRLILTKPVPARCHHVQVFVPAKGKWCHRQLLWVLLPAQSSWEGMWEHVNNNNNKHALSKQLSASSLPRKKESIAWIHDCFYDFPTYLYFCSNSPEFCTIHLGQILYVLEATRRYQSRKQESRVLKYKPVICI